MIITFSFVMIPAGLLQDRIGPRKVATAGAIAMFIGYTLPGLAAVLFAPLKKSMINSYGVHGTFIILALIVGIVTLTGAGIIKNQPHNYMVKVPGKHPGQQNQSSDEKKEDMPPEIFIRTPVFYLLWFALAMVIGGGLTAIGLITAYGEVRLNLAPAVAATAISAYALVNGIGRPLAGSWLWDLTGSFSPAFYLAGVTTVIGLFLLIILNRKFGVK